jgi:DMSO reductase anchor subunit
LSLIFFVFCAGFVLGPVALIGGVVSLRKVTRSEGLLRGRSTAAIGIVLGIAGLIASIMWLIHVETIPATPFCIGPGGNLC